MQDTAKLHVAKGAAQSLDESLGLTSVVGRLLGSLNPRVVTRQQRKLGGQNGQMAKWCPMAI